MGTQRGGDEWRGEVESWRASGKSADAFAKGQGYSASSLRRWAALIPPTGSRSPGFVQLQVIEAASSAAASDLVVTVGRAEIRVGRGFDAELLRRVVETLSGGAK